MTLKKVTDGRVSRGISKVTIIIVTLRWRLCKENRTGVRKLIGKIITVGSRGFNVVVPEHGSMRELKKKPEG